MSFMAEGISLGRWKKKPVWAEQVCEGKMDSFMASYSLPLPSGFQSCQWDQNTGIYNLLIKSKSSRKKQKNNKKINKMV